jgi:transposase
MSLFSLTAKQRHRLEHQLKGARDVRLYRRTLAVLEYDRGQSVVQIAQRLEVDRRSVHRWLATYHESLDPQALADDPRPGRPPTWTEECAHWLQAFLPNSPAQLGYFAVNWSVPLLQECLELSCGRRFSDDTLRRQLRHLGYVWKRTRYVLDPDPEREKKTPHPQANQGPAAAQRTVGRR